MMTDFFGNQLIPHQTLEHKSTCFQLALEQSRQAQVQHDIQVFGGFADRLSGDHYRVNHIASLHHC